MRIGLSYALALMLALFTAQAAALECGVHDFPACKGNGSSSQYGDKFDPQVGFGGFGGGDCRAGKAPVIFIHGNGDTAFGWDSPLTHRPDNLYVPEHSVYEEFTTPHKTKTRFRGDDGRMHTRTSTEPRYNDCEVFGVTYLSPDEQKNFRENHYAPAKYEIVWRFIQAVKQYTGQPQVDIVAHSLGVGTTIAALDYYTDVEQENAWSSVRRFVNIAGSVRGLMSCLVSIDTTCRGEYEDNPWEFGHYPQLTGALSLPNRWTADDPKHGLRYTPTRHPETRFYTIYAGVYDELICLTGSLGLCVDTPLFVSETPIKNVFAQLMIGHSPVGHVTPIGHFDPDFMKHLALGNDWGGIGHFGARNYSGEIIYRMLTTDCRDNDCAATYQGTVEASKRVP